MSKLLRLAFVTTLLLGPVTLFPVLAKAADTAQNHTQAITTPVGKFIQDLGNQAIGIIADKGINQDQRSEKFREMLRTSFDLPTIGRFVIGRSWNAASPAQQQEYMKLFEALVIKSYSDRFALYTGEGFQVTGIRTESEKDSIVISEITHPDGSEPTSVDWRVRKRDGKLGIIDVVVEGVSLSVTQRQEYSSIIQRDGGKLDGLLEQMRQQVDAPANGN
jgi:phospholipid transport system substrate-binding protein